MCKICFGNPMSENHYKWLYGDQNGFYSYIMLSKNKVIAHQAIIERKYSFQGRILNIGLSSGTMILPEYQKSGDFYYLLKVCLSNFNGDLIIGFPNENSHGILRKIFKFKCVPQNLYRFDFKNKLKYIDDSCSDSFIRDDIKWRIDQHPLHQYTKLQKGDCHLIYKEYSGDSIDILYTNIISKDFIDILSIFSKKYAAINIISIQGEILERIGFEKIEGNEFVYKAYNSAYQQVSFPCQMIDSDVY